jgi:SAM-dependent methyltransferase
VHDDGEAEGYDAQAVRYLYDGMAADYALRFGSELADADPADPDIEFLRQAADSFPDGPVLDLGCGPAQVARFLIARGRSVVGLDLSWGMLTQAAKLAPRAGFIAADVVELPLRTGSCAGAIASYSLHHLPKARLGDVLAGIYEVLVPGGVLVVITHGGSGEERLDRPEGRILLSRYPPDELAERLEAAGFTPELIRIRPPQTGEFPAQKIRISARR